MAAAETHGAAKLGDQVLAVLLGQLAPGWVVHRRCLVDVLFDLGQPAAVGLAGTLIEHGQATTREPAVVIEVVVGARAGGERSVVDGHEIQHVELAARFGE